jgi:hypothetical protein
MGSLSSELGRLCASGRVQDLGELVRKWAGDPGLLPAVIAGKCYAFRKACEGGHSLCAEPLARVATLAQIRAAGGATEGFMAACNAGQSHTARWLARAFVLGPEDFRERPPGALHRAKTGCPEELRWLLEPELLQ